MNPLSTSDAPKILDRSIKRFYIKNGQRSMPTSDGSMKIPADVSRHLFGKFKGGKYSKLQD